MILYSWSEFLLLNQRKEGVGVGGERNLKKWDNHAPTKLRQNLQAIYNLIITQVAQNLKGNRFLLCVLLPIYDLDSYCATLNTDGWVRNHDPWIILLDSCNKFLPDKQYVSISVCTVSFNHHHQLHTYYKTNIVTVLQMFACRSHKI